MFDGFNGCGCHNGCDFDRPVVVGEFAGMATRRNNNDGCFCPTNDLVRRERFVRETRVSTHWHREPTECPDGCRIF